MTKLVCSLRMGKRIEKPKKYFEEQVDEYQQSPEIALLKKLGLILVLRNQVVKKEWSHRSIYVKVCLLVAGAMVIGRLDVDRWLLDKVFGNMELQQQKGRRNAVLAYTRRKKS